MLDCYVIPSVPVNAVKHVTHHVTRHNGVGHAVRHHVVHPVAQLPVPPTPPAIDCVRSAADRAAAFARPLPGVVANPYGNNGWGSPFNAGAIPAGGGIGGAGWMGGFVPAALGVGIIGGAGIVGGSYISGTDRKSSGNGDQHDAKFNDRVNNGSNNHNGDNTLMNINSPEYQNWLHKNDSFHNQLGVVSDTTAYDNHPLAVPEASSFALMLPLVLITIATTLYRKYAK